jgi:hypothetical protein
VARQVLNSSVFLIAVGFSPCGFSAGAKQIYQPVGKLIK